MIDSHYRDEREGAKALADAWQCAHEALASVRIRELRQMSETESAERFARLLSPPGPYPLRKSSGLVEQQRIFDRLRTIS